MNEVDFSLFGKENDFIKETQVKISVIIKYVNKKNKIQHTKEIDVLLDDNILKKERLIKLIKENMEYNNKKYNPVLLFKWCIDIEPELLNEYMLGSHKGTFLTIEDSIKNIQFNKSIKMFHGINSFHIILHENSKSFNNMTKKRIRKN
jgi:hypothetical protein